MPWQMKGKNATWIFTRNIDTYILSPPIYSYLWKSVGTEILWHAHPKLHYVQMHFYQVDLLWSHRSPLLLFLSLLCVLVDLNKKEWFATLFLHLSIDTTAFVSNCPHMTWLKILLQIQGLVPVCRWSQTPQCPFRSL